MQSWERLAGMQCWKWQVLPEILIFQTGFCFFDSWPVAAGVKCLCGYAKLEKAFGYAILERACIAWYPDLSNRMLFIWLLASGGRGWMLLQVCKVGKGLRVCNVGKGMYCLISWFLKRDLTPDQWWQGLNASAGMQSWKRLTGMQYWKSGFAYLTPGQWR